MQIEQQVVTFDDERDTRQHLPKILKWQGVNMVRNHSFLATCSEIVKVCEGAEADIEGTDAIRIGIVGDTHTGKSTLADAIAHGIHKKSALHWIIKRFSKTELLDFANTLSKLAPTNHILIFDDVSFLASIAGKKKIDMIQQSATEIRHLPGGKDVKIIAMYGYHYTKALPPYLRQSDFKYYTSVGSSELHNMEEMLGGKKMAAIVRFQKQFTMARVKGYYRFSIGGKEMFTYKYRNPWIMCLFWNNLSLRTIISPTRKWLQPMCSTCSEGTSQISVKEFLKEMGSKFGEPQIKSAVKQELRLRGINAYSPKLVQATRYLEKAMDMKVINIEEVGSALGLTITNTKLRKKLEGVLKS